MPISEKQREQMKQKRQKIMKVATELFSNNGYDNTPLSLIAKEAGISHGNFFTYFASKDELFKAVIAEPLLETSKEILSFSEDPESPIHEIEQMIKRHIKLYATLDTQLRLIQQVVGQYTRFSEEFMLLDAFHTEFKEKLTKLIIKGQKLNQLLVLDANRVAVSYTSFLMGLRLNLTDPADSEIWESFVPNAIQIFAPIQKKGEENEDRGI